MLSLHEMFGAAGKSSRSTTSSTRTRSSTASTSSACCSTATTKNAYWYGSQLSLEETRELAPYQNATGLQVTSAVLAGMVWALENPEAGIVEADEMDYKRCLEVQPPYLGPVKGYYTDWTPLDRSPGPLPRGHRREGPLAVPQHPGALTNSATRHHVQPPAVICRRFFFALTEGWMRRTTAELPVGAGHIPARWARNGPGGAKPFFRLPYHRIYPHREDDLRFRSK